MVAAKKFWFDRVFDAEVRPARRETQKEAPPPEPTYTRAEIAAAREQGFVEGREAGAAEALASIESSAASALAEIGRALESLAPVIGEGLQRCRQDAIGIARAATSKLVERSAAEGALAAVENVVAEVLPRIIDEPRIVVRINDALLDALQQRLPEVATNAGFPGSLILLGERELKRPDCRIEWADGGAEYDTAGLWREVDEIIERYCAEIGAAGAGPSATAVCAEQTNSEEHAHG